MPREADTTSGYENPNANEPLNRSFFLSSANAEVPTVAASIALSTRRLIYGALRVRAWTSGDFSLRPLRKPGFANHTVLNR